MDSGGLGEELSATDLFKKISNLLIDPTHSFG